MFSILTTDISYVRINNSASAGRQSVVVTIVDTSYILIDVGIKWYWN